MDFVDIQVNGYAGIDLQRTDTTPEELQLMARRLRNGGVRAVLPTIVTDALDRMSAKLAHLHHLIEQDDQLRRLMPAFHIEGPCLSPVDGFRGFHEARCIQPARIEIFRRLFDAAGGRVAMVTLAPEMDPDLKTTRWLVEQRVVVCAGHTDAPLPLLREVEQLGVRLFTHLGNGCPRILDRHDNILNRALSLEQMKYSLIADGQHLPWFVLRNWIRRVGVHRCIFTTDCVTPADAPPGRYRIGRWEAVVGPDGHIIPPNEDHLIGSTLTMRQAYHNALEYLGLGPSDAESLCAGQPAAAIERWLR